MRMTAEENIAELQQHGFCILRDHFSHRLIHDCRQAFLPVLSQYLTANTGRANRGTHRHFLAMPFNPPCFAPEFFFDSEILTIVRRVMDERVVADQWGCDVPVLGSDTQNIHVVYQRPLFPETPDVTLPAYMLVVSFGLIEITPALGPIEIAPGTHRIPRSEALRAIECGQIPMFSVTLNIGDVLIRHPWALHRGTPNLTQTPRPLLIIRYVRRWYADSSRDVSSIPLSLWHSFTPEQQAIMRFPLGE
jgi:ectoine hydroxylase-related dioxygenase (phytanoyl-CoA dioxygenase family)